MCDLGIFTKCMRGANNIFLQNVHQPFLKKIIGLGNRRDPQSQIKNILWSLLRCFLLLCGKNFIKLNAYYCTKVHVHKIALVRWWVAWCVGCCVEYIPCQRAFEFATAVMWRSNGCDLGLQSLIEPGG